MNIKDSASQILSSKALNYLEGKAAQNDGVYEFERNEVVNYLNEAWQDHRNTPGAQTGALNRLFDSSPQITKIAHGKYVYHISDNLTAASIISELQKCHSAIHNLTVDFAIIDQFTAEDRKLIYNSQKVLYALEELINDLEN